MADLFGHVEAHACKSDPDTSHTAADEVTPRIRELQAAVLGFAADRGMKGFIDPELNDHFQVHSSTYRTRRAELVGMGLIEDSGERVSIGGAGRKHALWRIMGRGVARCMVLCADGLSKAA